MATVTREQRAIEAWAKAMATAENYAVDPHQHIARLVEAGEQMAALLAPKDAAALASPPAADETRELAIARHALALIEPHTTRGITDCSTPLHIRVQNIVEGLEKAEREIERLKALAQPNRGDAIRLTACMAGFKPCADCQHREFCRSWLDGVGRCVKAQAPPASDPPGPTVINEDDGDVTIDFDYAKDRVVSIRLGEESSGLSAFVDGESHALCPLDRVPPKVLALLRTEAKAVTLRQSDPPGLVANWRPIETAPKRTDVLAGWADRPHWLPQVLQQDDAGMWFNGEESDYRPPTHWMPLPASPQAKED